MALDTGELVAYLPNADYDGTVSLPEVRFPAGLTLAALQVDRTNWTAGTSIALDLELSQDGTNWTPFGSITADDNGDNTSPTEIEVIFRDGMDSGTMKVRGTMTIIGGPLNTILTLRYV